VVSAITQNGSDVNPNVAGLQIYAGSLLQYSGSATDPGNLPLNWRWSYAINGGAETVLLNGTGAVTSISYNHTAESAGTTVLWKLHVSNGYSAAEATLSVAVEAPPPAGSGLSFSADSGTITAPFELVDGYISQPSQTVDPAAGGRAVYSFRITDPGHYVVQATVDAANDGANSLFFNIDAEPESPDMICDLPLTSGFEKRVFSWRGNGTFDRNQFVPKSFQLSAGDHQLVIRGREGDTKLAGFSILKLPVAPRGLRVRTRS
jgi:hypothetical protein